MQSAETQVRTVAGELTAIFDLTTLLVAGRKSEALEDLLGSGEFTSERVSLALVAFVALIKLNFQGSPKMGINYG
jgi:hypothetical protein